ncbi:MULTISPECIES: hypothetical protein [unclassified Serratia (in: enterobacteria)]|uniref:hypothetical protein n=1 Tax=unclassified Serratia (in: enterobacteria) TaxID=2647522 RepID=UPI00050087F4|nr:MULTISPECIES: hypothetical protein [unclassified Serratia (in: enterobacteria)]KFK92336.1 hypothetical protein JV45_21720 [Serratia sp. Ag2]KFK98821.1 hypothetical protein IV04_11670 [Serratia sp. Ag1]
MDELLSFYNKKSASDLIKHLDSFLDNGYLEENSFEYPNDEAFYCLLSLSSKDQKSFNIYNKKILDDKKFSSDYLKSTCLESLYFHDQREFFDYVNNNLRGMGAPTLSKFLDILIFISTEESVREFFVNNQYSINKKVQMLKKISR